MRRDYLFITVIALVLFFPFLGSAPLFDWDEINFAECAREMLLTGEWMRPQIDYAPFWEKPPLFLWMQSLSMSVFGVNEFAARLPNAIAGLLTLLLVFAIGSKLYNRTFGWIWVTAWIGSLLPHLYFRSGIIDPWFNLFIFIGIYGFIRFRFQFFSCRERPNGIRNYKPLLWGGASLGLAMLTKGPVAYLIAILVFGIVWLLRRYPLRSFVYHLFLFSLAAFVTASLWFAVEWVMHGSWFIREFIAYQIRLFSTPDSGHGGFWGYHAVVLLLGCFPASVFALPNLWGDRQCQDEILESDTICSCKQSEFTTWMQVLFWVVLILFSIVKTKIVHYSSLCYFPLTYLAALTVWRAWKWKMHPRFLGYFLLIGIPVGAIVAILPWLGQHVELIKPIFRRDNFAMANLEAGVEWRHCQGFPGILLVLSTLAAMWYWFKQRAWDAFQTAFIGGTVFTSLSIYFLINNIEQYSQHAAVEFYQQRNGEDCYVKTLGFKSYAHLFYTRKPPVTEHPRRDDFETCARGNPGKKVYFVAKITNLDGAPDFPGCRELYRKNGFVFFERVHSAQ